MRFGGGDAFRQPLVVEAADFIGMKSFRARGKRITTYAVEAITELEPLRREEPQPQEPEEPAVPDTPEEPFIDENGQKSLF